MRYAVPCSYLRWFVGVILLTICKTSFKNMNNSVECALEYKTHVYCDLPKEVDRVDTCMPSIECDIV